MNAFARLCFLIGVACFLSIEFVYASNTGKVSRHIKGVETNDVETSLRIIYPAVDQNWRSEYTLVLLEHALSYSGKRYELVPSETGRNLPKARKFALLENGQFDVMWSMTQKDREAKFLPVRIPIFKGLAGWRLLLIHQDSGDLFKSIRDFEQFRGYKPGQLHAWTDVKILEHNGIGVVGAPTYNQLFEMLARKRFDYFPRSVVEAATEAAIHKDKGIVIDSHVALHYPAAMYYFVAKQNKWLADEIEAGLNAAIKDGSFDELFSRFYGEIVDQSHLGRRWIFELENPLLPEITPLDRKELWYSPESEAVAK